MKKQRTYQNLYIQFYTADGQKVTECVSAPIETKTTGVDGKVKLVNKKEERKADEIIDIDEPKAGDNIVYYWILGLIAIIVSSVIIKQYCKTIRNK